MTPPRKESRTVLLASVLLGIAVVASSVAHAASFIVVNADDPGEGFNDPAPRAPVGGNPGTTLGDQRLMAFQRAADIWGARIASSVTIRIRANFDPLDCGATTAVLGMAAPNSFFRDFTGAPHPGTFYSGALANALHGSDLNPSTDEIHAQFNSTVGTTCPFPKVWYYGFDGNAGSDIDFVSVVLHELGHGLGFLSAVSLSTGAKLLGFDDTFTLNLEHHGETPADYPSMTNAQRLAASQSPGNLHWVGPRVREASGVLTAGKVGDHVRMFAPNPQQPGSSVSHWDTVASPNQLIEPVYTGPRDPVLELPLFQDIGWTLLPAKPSVTLNLNQAVFGPGQALTLAMVTQPGIPASPADFYLVLVAPGGAAYVFDGVSFALVFDGTQVFAEAVKPFRSHAAVTYTTETIVSSAVPGSIPHGTYAFMVVLVNPGTDPLNASNWLTSPGQAAFRF